MALKFEIVTTRVRDPKKRSASHWIKSPSGGTLGYLADPTITRSGYWNVKMYGYHVSQAPDFAAAQAVAESLYRRG